MDGNMTVAHYHMSLFPTRMALARWAEGGDMPHVLGTERNMPMRAAWYAQAQDDFQAWLTNGGFRQAEAAGGGGGAGLDDRPASPASAQDKANDQATLLFQQLCIKTWPVRMEEG